jgi:hypothetical protein
MLSFNPGDFFNRIRRIPVILRLPNFWWRGVFNIRACLSYLANGQFEIDDGFKPFGS